MMRKKRFIEEQIVRILRHAEAASQTVAEACKQHGIAEQTWCRWKKKFGHMEVGNVRQLRELEKENARLKRIVADRDLEIDAIKDVLKGRFLEAGSVQTGRESANCFGPVN